MNSPKISPYGAWKSPWTPQSIASGSVRLKETRYYGDNLYWLEQRPLEGGRTVLVVRLANGEVTDLLPAPFNARTRVHEYGGGPYCVTAKGAVFSHFADSRLYLMPEGAAPSPITPETSELRFADMVEDRLRDRVISVVEDHSQKGEAENYIAAVSLKGGRPLPLVGGHDFFSSPRLSPDGRQLAWLSWDHPNLPWDGTSLSLAEVFEEGNLGPVRQIAGGISESICQPQWSPEGTLHFVSDKTGFWNLYRWEGHAVPIRPEAVEYGLPDWVFGQSSYTFLDEHTILATYLEKGLGKLMRIDTRSGQGEVVLSEKNEFSYLTSHPQTGTVACLCASATEVATVHTLSAGGETLIPVRRQESPALATGYISSGRPIEFPTPEGTSHALFYAPKNQDFAAPAGEKPPLIVMSHGGPTGAASPALAPGIQFWTSRGFAVVDVNYGGSTGYGREYRMRLNGNWGIVDVRDCIEAAHFLVKKGLVDPKRLAIRGGSAGGYTTLAALTFHEVFHAGASYYGVSDVESLCHDTHKFESRYNDNLIGPLSTSLALLRERSPIHSVDRLKCPLILLQGLDDKVVPPNQSERMYIALRDKGIPTAYLAFAGEQHGFRKAENIARSLEAELYFYSRVFRFEPAEPLPPLEIANLPRSG